jgi:hypothetical protein
MQRCAGNWNQRRSHRIDEKKGEISPTPPQAPRASARLLKWTLHYSVTMSWDTASCASDYYTYKATPRSSPNARGCMLLNDNAIAASRFPFTSPPPSAEWLLHLSVWHMVRRQYRPCHKFSDPVYVVTRLAVKHFCPRREKKNSFGGRPELAFRAPTNFAKISDFCFVDCRKAVSDFMCYIERGSQTTHILGQIAR